MLSRLANSSLDISFRSPKYLICMVSIANIAILTSGVNRGRITLREHIHNRFTQAVFRCVERSLLNFIREIGGDAHGAVNSRVQF